MSKTHKHKARFDGLRMVACFEAAKGLLVLLTGCGVLLLIHKDLHAAAEELVRHIHLNPSSHYPSIFIDAISRLNDAKLWALAFSALFYAGVRFVEAFGLWHAQSWAEWFGLLSGAMYLPLELFELASKATWPRATALGVNLIIVLYLGRTLLNGRPHHKKRGRG